MLAPCVYYKLFLFFRLAESLFPMSSHLTLPVQLQILIPSILERVMCNTASVSLAGHLVPSGRVLCSVILLRYVVCYSG
jgi:hypothetical protein